MFFSVCVCLYNVEKYFPEGLEYLLRQTFGDFEILLIDDGSTDRTPELCDRAARADSRIRVFHQKNCGLGGARNKAIEAAAGKYLCFYDVDDAVAPDWLALLHDNLAAKMPQLLVYGYREINEQYRTVTRCAFEAHDYDSREALRAGYVENLSGMKFNNGFAWNKVYSRAFVMEHGLRFSDMRIQQDEVFNHALYLQADCVAVIADVLYDYYIRGGNIRSRYIPDRTAIFCRVRASFLHLCDAWALNDDCFLAYIHERFIKSLVFNGNKEGRGAELKAAVQLPETRESLEFLLSERGRKSRPAGSFVFNAYLRALQKRSLWAVRSIDIASALLTKAKYRLKKLSGR